MADRRAEAHDAGITSGLGGHGDETVRQRLLAEGAVACLFKPFSETALLEAINAALGVN